MDAGINAPLKSVDNSVSRARALHMVEHLISADLIPGILDFGSCEFRDAEFVLFRELPESNSIFLSFGISVVEIGTDNRCVQIDPECQTPLLSATIYEKKMLKTMVQSGGLVG